MGWTRHARSRFADGRLLEDQMADKVSRTDSGRSERKVLWDETASKVHDLQDGKPSFRKLRTGATELPEEDDRLHDSDEEDEGLPFYLSTLSLNSRISVGSRDDEPEMAPERSDRFESMEPQKVVPTPGSEQHGTGCKPCLWFWKPQGCQKGSSCSYCHLCPQNEFTARKKLAARLRKDQEVPEDLPFTRPPPGLAEPCEPSEVPEEQLSIGQVLHRAGMCRPCSSFFATKGCPRGQDCFHCHVCPSDEAKRRRPRTSVGASNGSLDRLHAPGLVPSQ
ncbi:unnamed protein product [Effrenium voratum]|uniref:C3H1-type domain-containing protein n=1 Tax=Effrenium voratum TaxID=2562239 RepID=A0AA36MQA0_9DINO|nr:unnamed protein product [Effrenium voratum]